MLSKLLTKVANEIAGTPVITRGSTPASKPAPAAPKPASKSAPAAAPVAAPAKPNADKPAPVAAPVAAPAAAKSNASKPAPAVAGQPKIDPFSDIQLPELAEVKTPKYSTLDVVPELPASPAKPLSFNLPGRYDSVMPLHNDFVRSNLPSRIADVSLSTKPLIADDPRDRILEPESASAVAPASASVAAPKVKPASKLSAGWDWKEPAPATEPVASPAKPNADKPAPKPAAPKPSTAEKAQPLTGGKANDWRANAAAELGKITPSVASMRGVRGGMLSSTPASASASKPVLASAPVATPKPASAPVTAPVATPAKPNAGKPGKPALGSLEDRRAIYAKVPAPKPVAPAANAPIDLSKISRKDMAKYRRFTGARDMNSEMDRWKTWQAMHGNPNASNADYYAWKRKQRASKK